jgi:hypothetical protein
MAHHRLGHAAEARQNLETSRAVVAKMTGSADAIAPVRALLREAETLIGAPASK